MMKKNKAGNGWIKMPEGIAKISQVKYISGNGTYALTGNRYSRGFFVDGRTDGKLWQNLFRVIRNENLECLLSLGKIAEIVVLQIIFHSLNKHNTIEKEFDKQMEEIYALLGVMNVKLLPMNREERMAWLLYTLDGRNETNTNQLWNSLADFNCKLSIKMSEKADDVKKIYFLRRGQPLSDKFVKELQALSGNIRILLHMEPISNFLVQKNLKRLYGNDGKAQDIPNYFTNMSFMVFIVDSAENMAYIERDLQSICSHYGQEMILLEETSGKQSRNLAYMAGTSSCAGRYMRCYQTQVIENLVRI